MRKYTKALAWFLTGVFCISLVAGLFEINNAAAIDPSGFDIKKFQNSFIPELAKYDKGHDNSLLTESVPKITNLLQLVSDDNEHQVSYTETSYGKRNPDKGLERDWHCWKMSSAKDYFGVVGDYHYCFTVPYTGTINHGIYIKVPKGEFDKNKNNVRINFIDNKKNYFLSLEKNSIFNYYTTRDKVGRLQAEYMWYLINGEVEWRAGMQSQTCKDLVKNGGTATTTHEIYERCFFPTKKSFDVKIELADGKVPSIKLRGHNFELDDAIKYAGIVRPELVFKFRWVVKARGFGDIDNNFHYFVADKHPNLGIQVVNCASYIGTLAKDEPVLTTIGDPKGTYDDKQFSVRFQIEKQSYWDNFINVLYNNPDGGKYAAGSCPDVKYLNEDKVKQYGGESLKRQETGSGDGCSFNIGDPINSAIAAMQCYIVKGLMGLLTTIGNWMSDASGMTYNNSPNAPPKTYGFLGIKKAYAATPTPTVKPNVASASPTSMTTNNQPFSSDPSNPLSKQLNLRTADNTKDVKYRSDIAQVMVDIWKGMLVFIDSFLAFALLYLAFANIFRINVNTYEVKKVLPGLIIGIFAANISWFICIALIDVANMAAHALAGGYPVEVTKSLMDGLIGTGSGSSVNGVNVKFKEMGFGEFLLDFLILVVLIVMFLVIALLLWVRGIFIMILYAVSPLAFLASGFPMTNQYFKKWWGEFSKWVFMLPIMFFILRIAAQVVNAGEWSFYKFVIAAALTWAAVKVPLSAGGIAAGAMGRISSAGNKAKGLGIQGAKFTGLQAGKGVDRLSGRAFTGAAKTAKAWKAQRAEEKENFEALREAKAKDLASKIRGKTGYAVRQFENQQVAKERKFFNEVNMDHTDLQNMINTTKGDMKKPGSKFRREGAMLELMETGYVTDIFKADLDDEKLIKNMGFASVADYKAKVGQHLERGDKQTALINLMGQAHNANMSLKGKKAAKSKDYQRATSSLVKAEGIFYKKGQMDKTGMIESDGQGGRRIVVGDPTKGITSEMQMRDNAIGNMTRQPPSSNAKNLPDNTFFYEAPVRNAAGEIMKDADGKVIKEWQETELMKDLREATEKYYANPEDETLGPEATILQGMANYYKGSTQGQRRVMRHMAHKELVKIPASQIGGRAVEDEATRAAREAAAAAGGGAGGAGGGVRMGPPATRGRSGGGYGSGGGRGRGRVVAGRRRPPRR